MVKLILHLGREMITLFMEKPSRKDYPDYYKLILEPIDMRTIERKIKQDKYVNVEDVVTDFQLMFNNARHYNEPGSQVCCLLFLLNLPSDRNVCNMVGVSTYI